MLTLIEMIALFDFADEVGRARLKQMAPFLLSQHMNEEFVTKLMRSVELLIPDQKERMDYISNIINGYIGDSNETFDVNDKTIATCINGIRNMEARIEILKVKMDIEEMLEEETVAMATSDFDTADTIKDQLTTLKARFVECMVRAFGDEDADDEENKISRDATLAKLQNVKEMDIESVVQCLKIYYHAIASEKTKTLESCMCDLYKVKLVFDKSGTLVYNSTVSLTNHFVSFRPLYVAKL